jgi:hypothetical protein
MPFHLAIQMTNLGKIIQQLILPDLSERNLKMTIKSGFIYFFPALT